MSLSFDRFSSTDFTFPLCSGRWRSWWQGPGGAGAGVSGEAGGRAQPQSGVSGGLHNLQNALTQSSQSSSSSSPCSGGVWRRGAAILPQPGPRHLLLRLPAPGTLQVQRHSLTINVQWSSLSLVRTSVRAKNVTTRNRGSEAGQCCNCLVNTTYTIYTI